MKTSKVRTGSSGLSALVVVIIGASAITMLSCGKKGPPEPPTGSRPPSVQDLSYGISQNTIKLSWSVPQPDPTALLPITGFLIYRSQQPVLEKACPSCPRLFKIIGDVPVRGPGAGQSGQLPITFTETIEPDYRYTYKVHGYSADGIRSKSSNFIEFTH